MSEKLQEWTQLAQKAADRLARELGVSDLTPDAAEEFAELGRPDMVAMIGRPVGISPADYRTFVGNPKRGPDLDFMLDLIAGKHLNEKFLKNAC